jgi:hypothetical protein
MTVTHIALKEETQKGGESIGPNSRCYRGEKENFTHSSFRHANWQKDRKGEEEEWKSHFTLDGNGRKKES